MYDRGESMLSYKGFWIRIVLLVACLTIVHASGSRVRRFLGEDFNPNATSSPPIQNCRYHLSITGTGSILSPYFGHTKYPPNAICTWKLFAPPDKIIRLHFNGFNLENATHCAGDNVRVFDGINSNANVLGEYCGHTSPPDLLSSGHQMLVFFYSDSSVEDDGFNITYSLEIPQISVSIFEDDGCHGKTKDLTSSSGLVTSPGYDGFTPYENSKDCSWRIQAPSGSVVTLTFNDFLTEKIEGCTYDYLAIYDGPNNQSTKLAQFCGMQFPDDITSSGTSLFIHFVSDQDVAGTGFSLSYTIHSPVAPCSQFQCGNGGCVGEQAVCNNASDCTDSTDEVACVNGGCGYPDIAPIDTSHKIVGGREAIAHSWPWMVSLMVNGSHTCGGTLLSQSWVLTAAHCFEANRRTSDWSVAAGKHHLTKPELTSQVRAVGKIIVNSRYNFMTTDNDVAVVKLTVPFYRNAYVSSVCLPATEPVVGDACFVIGWGEVEGTCCPGVLKQAMLPIMNSSICNGRDYLAGQVTANMFCAGYENGGQDACQGDSGGPFLCKNGDQWHIQGITSFGSGCADVRSPGVYTRVYNYLRWIRQKIALN